MKTKLLALIIGVMLLFTGCGGCNMQVIDLNYSFDKAYVKVGDEWKDLTLKSWRDYEDGEQLQLTLTDGTVMVVHSANCILYNGNLPK